MAGKSERENVRQVTKLSLKCKKEKLCFGYFEE
jgi:hypothetical protein